MERPANLEFSERLKGAMKRAELKGKDLAEKLSVSPNTVTDWRNGAYLPEGERLTKLARALSVTDQWLIFGDRPSGVAEGLNAGELRGYAIAVRDMLENARILQQRVIDGLTVMYPITQPKPTKLASEYPPGLVEGVLATNLEGAEAAKRRRSVPKSAAAKKSASGGDLSR